MDCHVATRLAETQILLGARAARPPLFIPPHLAAAGILRNLSAHLGCKTRRRHGLLLHNASAQRVQGNACARRPT